MNLLLVTMSSVQSTSLLKRQRLETAERTTIWYKCKPYQRLARQLWQSLSLGEIQVRWTNFLVETLSSNYSATMPTFVSPPLRHGFNRRFFASGTFSTLDLLSLTGRITALHHEWHSATLIFSSITLVTRWYDNPFIVPEHGGSFLNACSFGYDSQNVLATL
jgi:hypothetical protein